MSQVHRTKNPIAHRQRLRGPYVSNAAPSASDYDDFTASFILWILRIDRWIDVTSHTLGKLEWLGVCAGVGHCWGVICGNWVRCERNGEMGRLAIVVVQVESFRRISLGKFEQECWSSTLY